MSAPTHATAVATSNIALVKYWGKRDEALNLPTTGSISVTLDALTTRTTVAFDPALPADDIALDGHPAGTPRMARFLDLVRDLAGVRTYARVQSRNDFPTGAGLASSASGFAALALACDAALGLGLDAPALSALARRGSGSAARSLLGGFAEMQPGSAADGHDAYAVALAPPDALPLVMLIAVTAAGPKAVGSTEGMRRTETTSPYHPAWVESTRRDLGRMRDAIAARDLEQVGHLAETNALRMHANMLAAEPALFYWNAATVAAIQTVHALRAAGTGAWITIDAGPQVKVICAPIDAATVEKALRAGPGVEQVLSARPGPGARLVEGTA
ncbi:MAG: diphosphomevalonate decarboxylase [Planctomycetota bacterium]|nr:diphosphomevalonate decarboxylase [Planctomycetota bacterium]